MGYWFGWVVGILSGMVAIMLMTWDEPSKAQVGYSYNELKEMKESCEKDLTRSENCVIVVSYKPEGKEEK